MASALKATDAASGVARVVFPCVINGFRRRPSFLVYPTEYTLSFDVSRGRYRSRKNVAIGGRHGLCVPGSGRKRSAFRTATSAWPARSCYPQDRGDIRRPTSDTAQAPPCASGSGVRLPDGRAGFCGACVRQARAGHSSGEWRDASFEDSRPRNGGAAEVSAGVHGHRRAAGRIWGLSQGACIAPLAAVRFGRAAFVDPPLRRGTYTSGGRAPG